MAYLQTVAGGNGINLNLGLPSGLSNAPGVQGSQVVLSDHHIKKIHRYADHFIGDRQEGIHRMLQELASEGYLMPKYVRQGSEAPGVFQDHFRQKVVMPLLVTTMGLDLSKGQRGALDLLMTLVSVPHSPASLPCTDPTFMMRFHVHEMNMAVRGKMDTYTGDVTSQWFDTEVELEKWVAGLMFGEKEMYFNSDPALLVDKILEKMKTLEVTWANTLTALHVQYSARQPPVQQLMLQHQVIHTPNSDKLGRLVQLLEMEWNILGCVNRSSIHLPQLLAACSEYIGGDAPDLVVVWPERLGRYSQLPTVKGKPTVPKIEYFYNTNSPDGMKGIALFGATSKNPYTDSLPISDGSLSSVSGQRQLKNDVVDHLSEEGTVEILDLGNGFRSYFISVPEVLMVDGKTTPADALLQEGTYCTYIPIGQYPEAYFDACNSNFFSTKPGKINPTSVLDYNPSDTYFIDYDRNKLSRISVADCHQIITDDAYKAIWDPAKSWKLFRTNYGVEKVLQMKPEEIADIIEEPYLLGETDQLIFEFDVRHMIVKSPNGNAANFTALSDGTGARMIPRLFLGNAGAGSCFHHEMVGGVGTIAAAVSDSCSGLVTLLEFISKQLLNAEPAKIFTLRNTDTAKWADIKTLIESIISDIDGVLSDPQIMVLFLKAMSVIKTNQPDTAASSGGKNAVYKLLEGKMDYIISLENVITEGIRCSRQVLNIVYPQGWEFNALLAENTRCSIKLVKTIDGYEWFYKFCYGMVLPSLTSALVRPAASTGTSDGSLFQAGNPEFKAQDYISLNQWHTDCVFIGNGSKAPTQHVMVKMYTEEPVGRMPCGVTESMQKRFKLARKFGGVPALLAFIMYWTRHDRQSVKECLDRCGWNSGLAYRGVRCVNFKSSGLSMMPVQSARLLTGNKGVAIVQDNWHNTEYKQMMQLAMTPMSASHLGVTVSGVFMEQINGLGSQIGAEHEDGMVLLDAYNTGLPHGQFNYQPGYSFQSIFGQFGGKIGTRDPVSGKYVSDPTTFLQMSSLLHNGPSNSCGVQHLKKTLEKGNFSSCMPKHYSALVDGPRPLKDVMKQVMGSAQQQSIFEKCQGVMFVDTCSVGRKSSQLLLGNSTLSSISAVDTDLTAKIHSQGGLAGNGRFGMTDGDSAFMQIFSKKGPGARMNRSRDF